MSDEVDYETLKHAVARAIETDDMDEVKELLPQCHLYDVKRALGKAAYKDKLDDVNVLLEAGADPDYKDIGGETALWEAATFGSRASYNTIERLLKASTACIDSASTGLGEGGKTALYKAAEYGHIEVVKALLHYGANLNIACDGGFFTSSKTPRMIASKNGHTAVVSLIDQYEQARELATAVSNGDKSKVGRLLANGVDPNTLDTNLVSVLYVAAGAGHVGVANKLIHAGAVVDTVFARGYAALHAAADQGHSAVITALLNAGADVNVRCRWGRTALIFAATGGHNSAVKVLLAAGADVLAVNNEGESARTCAINNRQKATVNLIANRATEQLPAAIQSGDLNLATALLREGARANVKKGFSPLMGAAQVGHVKIMHLLLSHDAEVNAVDENGVSPLLFAASCGHANIVDLLLKKGANINHQETKGMTAMHYAAESGRVGVVKRLLAGGADASIPDNNGLTPLMLALHNDKTNVAELLDASCTNPLMAAVVKGDIEQVNELLSTGTDTSAVNEHGATALHIAVYKGYDEIVSALLAAEADIDAKDKDGKTPEMLATTPATLKLLCDAKYSSAMKIADMIQAIKEDNVPAVLNLLAKNVDPNSANESGETLLHVAIINKRSSVLDVLLETDGIVHSKPNQAGVTPLVLAIRLGHYRLVNQIYAKVKIVTQQVTNYDVKYDENDTLGAGAFGAVYKGSFQGRAVAIKCGNNKNALKAEIDAMLQCKSPYIVDLIAIADRFGANPKLVLELMDGGSLDKHLEAKRLGKPTVVDYSNVEIAWVVAKALADLHHNGQVHRDLKSGNILLSTTNQSINQSNVFALKPN